jgi:hypothetical protein
MGYRLTPPARPVAHVTSNEDNSMKGVKKGVICPRVQLSNHHAMKTYWGEEV